MATLGPLKRIGALPGRPTLPQNNVQAQPSVTVKSGLPPPISAPSSISPLPVIRPVSAPVKTQQVPVSEPSISPISAPSTPAPNLQPLTLTTKPIPNTVPGRIGVNVGGGFAPPVRSIGNFASIVAPQRTTVSSATQLLSRFLPNHTPVTAQTLAGIDSNQFAPIQSFDDSYYQNLSNQASKRLQERYFTGADNILAQRENQIKRRGLFGSGIGENATNEVYKSFGDEMADVQAQLLTQQAENDLRLAQENRNFAYGLAKDNQDTSKFNIQNLLDTSFRNIQNRDDLAKLGLSAALDEARTSTDFDTKMFESQVKERDAARDYIKDVLSEINESLGNEKLDQETRSWLRNLFAGEVSGVFGRTYTAPEEDPPSVKADPKDKKKNQK